MPTAIEQKHWKKTILDTVEDGDILNMSPRKIKWWPPSKIPLAIGMWRIQAHQKKIFYDKQLRPNVYYKDHHTVVYFRGRIFSVEPPKARWWDAEEYVEKNIGEDIFTVLRYNRLLEDPEGELQPLHEIQSYIDIMEKTADKIVGTKYDYLSLVQVAINRILGYDFQYKYRFLDQGKERLFCSAGGRTCYEQLGHEIGRDKLPRLFSKLNRDCWSGNEIDKFLRVDVEATPPAIFSNSKLFGSEFKTIVRR